MSLQLKMQLLYLCTQAARDADPGPYAAIIVDQVPEDVLQPLINDPNWLDQLAKFHSNVRQFPEWFNELREAVIEEMQETPPDKNLQTQNSGDINPGNNGDSEDVLE